MRHVILSSCMVIAVHVNTVSIINASIAGIAKMEYV